MKIEGIIQKSAEGFCPPHAFVLMMAMAAGVIMTVVAALMLAMVMAAAGMGIKCQRTCQEGLHSLVGIAADTAVDLDVGILQCKAGAAANATADEHVHSQTLQEACQCAVTEAVVSDYFAGNNCTVFYDINLKLFGTSEVLENLTVFIRNRNFHIDYLLG